MTQYSPTMVCGPMWASWWTTAVGAKRADGSMGIGLRMIQSMRVDELANLLQASAEGDVELALAGAMSIEEAGATGPAFAARREGGGLSPTFSGGGVGL